MQKSITAAALRLGRARDAKAAKAAEAQAEVADVPEARSVN